MDQLNNKIGYNYYVMTPMFNLTWAVTLHSRENQVLWHMEIINEIQ